MLPAVAPALQPCPEEPSDKLYKPMEVELPLPLTEAVVAKALAELSQGAAAAIESCLECYRSKRMSSGDLLSFARSTSIHSPSLAAVFMAKDADAQDMGEAAGADDMAELMLLLGSGPARLLEAATLPAVQATALDRTFRTKSIERMMLNTRDTPKTPSSTPTRCSC
jgi:hypothetical protein